MNRDIAAVAVAAALWVAGPLVVLEAVAGVEVGPWPALSAAGAAGVGLAVVGALGSGLLSVDRLWSRWPVRATVWLGSLAVGVGIVAAAALASARARSPRADIAASVGLALLTVGAAGVATVLGRANCRRIETERDLATLGRRYDAPGRWARVLWVVIAVVQFGVAGALVADAGGPYSAFAVAQGVAFLCLGSLSRPRTWLVGDRGLVGGTVEHPWRSVESVRTDGGAVRIRFDSRWRNLGGSGLRRSLRFAREGVDERAIELLAAHADTVGDPRQYAGTAGY